MAQKQDITKWTDVFWQFMGAADPMLAMLEWLCDQMMEAEIETKIGAQKHEQSQTRTSYRSGYRPRRLDTRMGTIYLMVPKMRQGGYVPFFVTEHKRSETALIQVIQEAFVQGVSTRKMEKLAQSLGIASLSRSQVSEMTQGLNEQAEHFRHRSLADRCYPVIWVDALYERVRYDNRVISMAIQIVCGVNDLGQREILAIEPMLEESEDSYTELFRRLEDRGLKVPSLVISDAHKGLIAAIRRCFPGASWQRCKVHFMRNILVHIPHRDKHRFAGQLKLIWQAATAEDARRQAVQLCDQYRTRFPKAVQILEDGLEDSLSYYAYPNLDARKISSNNLLERLNREIRRRTRVVGIFPNPESYVRLITIYLLEYTEEWSSAKAYIREGSLKELLPQVA